MTPAEQLRESVLSLQASILSNHPQLPVLLRTIHKKLAADPDIVTLLSEEEIGILVSGLDRMQMNIIATSIASSPAKKSMKSITVADL